MQRGIPRAEGEKVEPSSGNVISEATTSVCRAVDGTYTAYTSSI